MAFVYCEDCGWSQDDFWNESYYPSTSVIEEVLVPGITDKTKRQIKIPSEGADSLGIPYDSESVDASTGEINIDFRLYTGYQLMMVAKKILSQYWVTEDDFNQQSEARCPMCNSDELEID